MSTVVRIRDCLFVDGCWVQNNNGRYFHCFLPSCPFSVVLSFDGEGEQRQPSVEKVVFPLHCHAFPAYKRKEVKKLLQAELEAIQRGVPESQTLDEKHQKWQVEAREVGKAFMEKLVYKTGFDQYALKHPEATGSQLRKKTGKKMTRRAASMAQRRALQKMVMQQTSPSVLRPTSTTSSRTRAKTSSFSPTSQRSPTCQKRLSSSPTERLTA